VGDDRASALGLLSSAACCSLRATPPPSATLLLLPIFVFLERGAWHGFRAISILFQIGDPSEGGLLLGSFGLGALVLVSWICPGVGSALLVALILADEAIPARRRLWTTWRPPSWLAPWDGATPLRG